MDSGAAVLHEFVTECDEILQRVFSNLAQIEKGDCRADVFNAVYRDMHTMKGSALLLGYKDIGRVAHVMESSLDPVRRVLRQPCAVMMDAIYRCLDLIDGLVRDLTSGMQVDRKKDITINLSNLIESTLLMFKSGFPLVLESAVLPLGPVAAATERDVIKGLVGSKREGTEKNSEMEANMESVPSGEQNLPPSPQSGDGGGEAQAAQTEAPSDTTIRVHVGLLDKLMNLVGEMVLVRNQVLQYSNRGEDLEFLNLSQRLDVVTSDLQDQVMKTRMQPIGNVLTKFQRLIRDLARDMGKKIDLTVQGKDTELDKTLLEAIKDPLTHIVRNCCDHGIEKPEDRIKAKKPETGHVFISAYHEGGQVVVEISDDGHGLNRDRIMKKAVEKGLVTAERGAAMPDREIFNLIFLPGFSTAEQVSSVSGRGVGMDVVKTNIEKIGGTVDLQSIPGKSMTIRLKIPLTLAIVPVMLVIAAGSTYAIPQIKLVELVRVELEVQGNHHIEYLQGKPVFRLRGKLLPLVELSAVLSKPATLAGRKQGSINIVVLNADGEQFGLIVDEILDTADIVVKPLSKFLKSLEVFSGATILGNGHVALILDVFGLSNRASISSGGARSENLDLDGAAKNAAKARSDMQEFLLFRTKAPGRFCMPLCMVNRLEEFSDAQVERSGAQSVVRYRDSVLPLVDLSVSMGFASAAPLGGEARKIPTIVVHKAGRAFGIVVEEILDVQNIDEPIDDSVRDRLGILGNLVTEAGVLVVVDILSVIDNELLRIDTQYKAKSQSQDQSAPVGVAAPRETKTTAPVATANATSNRVLFAEDVVFFRRQVSKLLSEAGYSVTAVEDGQAAIDLLRKAKPGEYSLVLSDIEMPKMNGYELARAVRALEHYKDVPLIALTTRFSKRDVEEGMRAGFNVYLEKLNPEKLMAGLNQFKETIT